MEKLAVTCPHCHCRYRVDAALRGKRARCKRCQASFALTRAKKTSAVRSGARKSSAKRSSHAPRSRSKRSRPAGPADVPLVWKPGTVILGLYQVQEVFTGGGMGLVYRVRHRDWNLDLAVKCPRPEFFRNDRDKDNFEREAETWVKLGLHPHTVSCYYVRRLGGIPHVFAEYIEGGTLADWIRRGKLYDGGPARALARVLDVAVQFAWGLHYAHAQDLVHRDVKPGNVLLTARGTVKVTDFGLARAWGAIAETVREGDPFRTQVSQGGLTPAYCSPEQAAGRPLSLKTDVWSWGLSVLEMFTGEASWPTGELAPHALAHYLDKGPARADVPPMPAEVAVLLRQCFERDPKGRPGDMRELVEVLTRVYREVTGRAYPREEPASAKALPDSLNNRAVSLLDLGKHQEAERAWRQALAADPGHPESTYNLGLHQCRSRRATEDALLHKLQEVCSSRPGEWLPPYLLAQVYLEQGDWAAAGRVLEKAVEAGGGAEELLATLATVRQTLAKTREGALSLVGHAGWVTAGCLSGDGLQVLTGSTDKTLRLWDAATGRCLRTFRGHTEAVNAVALTPDGRRALSGSADGSVRLWQVGDGDCPTTLSGHGGWVLSVAVSGDGRYGLSGSGDRTLKLWDLGRGRCTLTLEGHTGPVLSVCLRGGSRFAVSGSQDRTVGLWDLTTGRCLRTLEGHAEGVSAVHATDDGKYVLSGGRDKTVRLWEYDTGRCLKTLEGHAGGVTAVCLSPDERYALSASWDKTVRLWKLATGRCLHTFEAHTGSVFCVAFDADGRRALSGGGDDTLKLWPLPGDYVAPTRVARVVASEKALAASSDYEFALERTGSALERGDALAAVQWLRKARAQPGYRRNPEVMNQWGDLYMRLPRKGLSDGWERATLAEHGQAVTCLDFSRDGRLLVSGSQDRTVKLWDVPTAACLGTLAGHADAVTAVALAADGKHALSGSRDTTLRLWHLPTHRSVATLPGHRAPVTAVCWMPDGRHALSWSSDWTVKLWDVLRGQCLRSFEVQADPVHAVCLSPDGRFALSGSARQVVRNTNETIFRGGQLRLWDLATGHCPRRFDKCVEAVTAVALSRDGRRALAGGGPLLGRQPGHAPPRSGHLRLWDIATARCLRTLSGHEDVVTSACLTGDGRFALSGSADRTLRVWDLAAGRCLRTFEAHAGPVLAVCLSPDGRHAATAGADRTVKLWFLDWELEETAPADWDEGARPYLEVFLTLRSSYGAESSRARGGSGTVAQKLTRWLRQAGSDQALVPALARRGKPSWTDKDLAELLEALACAGYGWLTPEGVRHELERMSARWRGPETLQ